MTARDHATSSRRTGLPRWLVGLLWISPWVVGFLAFMAAPIALSLWYSLTDYTLLQPPEFVGLDNYARIATDAVFWTTVRNTVVFAAVAIPLSTLLSLIIAAGLARNIRAVGLYRTIVFLPSLVPVVASAVIWQWLFQAEAGLVNQLLSLVGINGPTWLERPNWAMAAVVITALWAIGHPVVIYVAAMKDVPVSLYEAAAIDGLGPVGRFTQVTLPMISPVVLFNVVVAIIAAWQVFAVPYIMTSGGPGRATYFYTMYLYDKAFRFGEMGYASAMAWIQMLIIVALTGVVLLASKRLVHHRGA